MHTLLRNSPNLLTILRIAAVPLFIFLMNEENYDAALWVFLFAELTDVLDGVIARRYNLITPFGKIADPFADKLMQLTALFMLASKDMILRVIPYLILLKELFMLISGLYLIRKKIDMSSKWFGKLTSVFFFIAIVLAFFGVSRSITDVVLWVGVGMALFAALMYIRNYFKQVEKRKTA